MNNTTKKQTADTIPATSLNRGLCVCCIQYLTDGIREQPGIYRTKDGSLWHLRYGASKARRVSLKKAMMHFYKLFLSEKDLTWDTDAQTAFLRAATRALPV